MFKFSFSSQLTPSQFLPHIAPSFRLPSHAALVCLYPPPSPFLCGSSLEAAWIIDGRHRGDHCTLLGCSTLVEPCQTAQVALAPYSWRLILILLIISLFGVGCVCGGGAEMFPQHGYLNCTSWLFNLFKWTNNRSNAVRFLLFISFMKENAHTCMRRQTHICSLSIANRLAGCTESGTCGSVCSFLSVNILADGRLDGLILLQARFPWSNFVFSFSSLYVLLFYTLGQSKKGAWMDSTARKHSLLHYISLFRAECVALK